MPNWCDNVVEVSHKDPAKLQALVDAYNDGKFCNYAIPVPDDLHITAGRVGSDDDQAQKDLVAQTEANKAKYGYENWYDFCVNEWGTKWDVGGDGDHVELEPGQTDTTFDFCSAWAPPVGVYAALVEQGFSVRAYYYEPGMAFCGIWEDGDDDFYELGQLTSAEAKEELPEILDDMFGISASMADWEAEETEEE